MGFKINDFPEHVQQQIRRELRAGGKKDSYPCPVAYVEPDTSHEQVAEETVEGRLPRYNIRVHQVRDRLTDPDNASCKACLDGIVKEKLLPDDGPKDIGEVRFSQRETTKEEIEYTVIDIIEKIS